MISEDTVANYLLLMLLFYWNSNKFTKINNLKLVDYYNIFLSHNG